MNEKNITLIIKQENNTRKMVIGISTALVIVSALTGCSKESELLNMINQGDMIEIEIAVPNGVDLSDEEALTWIILASLTSNPDLRASWEDTLKITISGDSKNGCLYVDVDGNQEDNNTLRVALHNRAFLTMLEDTKTMEALALAAQNEYADLDAEDDDKAFLAALNAYYNLLEDQTNGESGMDAKVTRAQFMSMVMRAETQVDENIVASDEFIESVGSSEYNNFASQVDEDCYLSTSYKNLNNKTYNDTMSRGEAVYLIVNHYFHDELELVDTKSASLDDCKDGGDIASKQKFMENGMPKDYYRDYEMVYAIQNPDDGAPTDIYKALVVAQQKGLITSETRWDEGITKSEALKLLVEALKQETGIKMFNIASGKSGEHAVIDSNAEVEVTDESLITISEDEEPLHDTEADGKIEATNSKNKYMGMTADELLALMASPEFSKISSEEQNMILEAYGITQEDQGAKTIPQSEIDKMTHAEVEEIIFGGDEDNWEKYTDETWNALWKRFDETNPNNVNKLIEQHNQEISGGGQTGPVDCETPPCDAYDASICQADGWISY